MRELDERTQMPGVSVDDYLHSINLFRARLEIPSAEGEMIKIPKRNLRQSIAQIVHGRIVCRTFANGMSGSRKDLF